MKMSGLPLSEPSRCVAWLADEPAWIFFKTGSLSDTQAQKLIENIHSQLDLRLLSNPNTEHQDKPLISIYLTMTHLGFMSSTNGITIASKILG